MRHGERDLRPEAPNLGRADDAGQSRRAPDDAEQDVRDAAVLSAGTDGIDGPTDAAGAYADTTTIARAKELSLDADAYLADNNAYEFFQKVDDLIITGPSTTNVGDLQIVLFRS